MILIAAVDENWAIGYENRLLLSIPEDMKFFRETTKGSVVVMGRKTLESFPGGNPLKNRVNIVLTKNPGYEKSGATVVHNTEELLAETAKYPDRKIFVIGGGSIYRTLLPFCRKAYITKMQKTFPADTWFPDLDADPEWEMTDTSEVFMYEDIPYSFVTYQRIEKCTETIQKQ